MTSPVDCCYIPCLTGRKHRHISGNKAVGVLMSFLAGLVRHGISVSYCIIYCNFMMSISSYRITHLKGHIVPTLARYVLHPTLWWRCEAMLQSVHLSSVDPFVNLCHSQGRLYFYDTCCCVTAHRPLPNYTAL